MIKTGSTDALVELVDIYPTLIELCGLKGMNKSLDGISVVPLLHDLNREGKDHILINNRNTYTIKTPRYSYTELLEASNENTLARALYDHSVDLMEEINVAEQVAYKSIVDSLHKILHNEYLINISVTKDVQIK